MENVHCLQNRSWIPGRRCDAQRIGLEEPCIYVEDLVEMSTEDLEAYDCIIVDEAQFCKKSDIEFFTHLVDDLEIPVICYGLRTDFQMHLFEGSMWLLAWADKIEELKTVCWCGSGARCNARIDSNGKDGPTPENRWK